MTKERVTVSLDPATAAKLRNEDNTSEVARRVFQAWYGNGEHELAFLRDRVNQLRNRREELQERQAQLREEQNRLEARLDEIAPKQDTVIEQAEPFISGLENPDNPAVENWADKAGLSPTQLLKAVNGNGDGA